MAVGAIARYASEAEVLNWDKLVLANPGGGVVWTGAQFLHAKRLNAYIVRHVIVERTDRPNIAVAVAAKKVPLLGEWWSLLGGPAGEDLDAVTEAVTAIAQLASGRRAFFLQVEPQLTGDNAQGFIDRGYLRRWRAFQMSGRCESTLMRPKKRFFRASRRRREMRSTKRVAKAFGSSVSL